MSTETNSMAFHALCEEIPFPVLVLQENRLPNGGKKILLRCRCWPWEHCGQKDPAATEGIPCSPSLTPCCRFFIDDITVLFHQGRSLMSHDKFWGRKRRHRSPSTHNKPCKLRASRDITMVILKHIIFGIKPLIVHTNCTISGFDKLYIYNQHVYFDIITCTLYST